MTDLIVAGAGMAGLAAAARARELGAEVEVWEKGARVGGSMLLSSGVVWRYRDWAEFRRQCRDGDGGLQRVVHELLDKEVDWLVGLGAPVVESSTGNPLTVGRRFDTRGLCAALLRTGPSLRIASALESLPEGTPVVLATGGFQASRELVQEWITPFAEQLLVRSNHGSAGDGMRLGLAAGGALSGGMDEFYGRAMPAVPALHETHWVQAAQLYARHARVVDADGVEFEGEVDWAEVEVVRWIARRPGARAWFEVGADAMGLTTRYGTVAELIERARGLGARVEQRGKGVAVEVAAAITQTLGGLRVDERARVLGADGRPVRDGALLAAGGDVGGIATGGYMSNLAAALVLGKRAAETALA